MPTIKKDEKALAALTRFMAAMYAARDVAMEKCGDFYKPTTDQLRQILRVDMKLYGVTPVQAMALHVGPGIDDTSMMLWLAATAEIYLEQAAAEPKKAVG